MILNRVQSLLNAAHHAIREGLWMIYGLKIIVGGVDLS